MTLDTIFSSFYNGQKKQFVDQVKEYGVTTFACDIGDYPTLLDAERYQMLKIYILLTNN